MTLWERRAVSERVWTVCALHSSVNDGGQTQSVFVSVCCPLLDRYFTAVLQIYLARLRQIIQLHCPCRCFSLGRKKKNSPSILLVLLPEELELLPGGELLASLLLTEIQSSDCLTHICPVVRNYLCPM